MTTTSPQTASQLPIRVTVSQRLMSPSVSYVDQIAGEGHHNVTFDSFTGMLRRTDMDVVHLHRLGALGGARATGGAKLIAVAMVFAAMLKKNRIALVRTLHGADARGGGGRSARIANSIINRVTTEFVVVDPATTTPGRASTSTIPYGHYRNRFVGYPRSERQRSQLLSIAPFRGAAVEQIAAATATANTSGITVRFVGSATDERAKTITGLVDADPATVSARIERLSDGALVLEITASELVVVPRVSELEDLHLVFLALSLDRPVLVPDNKLSRSIASSVGEEWVHLYREPLTASRLDEAFATLHTNPPAGQPNLEGRDADTTAGMYADVFRRAAQKVNRG